MLLKSLFALLFLTADLPFVLEHSPTPEKYLVETMGGGVAAFDYNNDGRPDLFFANGAPVPSMQKSGPKYWNRLLRNEGGGKFTDVTEAAGLSGTGFSIGAAAADFDNDGYPDLFVAGVQANRLYRNLGNGKFEDVTGKSGIRSDQWSVAAGWFDFDNDGLVDLFVVNYVEWSPESNPACFDPGHKVRVYCHPRNFAALANTLYRNLGNGRFEDVSAMSGISKFKGKGMSLAIADYDLDGFPDVFVTNDTLPNFLFHNRGDGTFEEVALTAGVALTDDGHPISAMGADFRDFDNDGLPDIVFTGLTGETFPLFRNLGKGKFRDATYVSKMGPLSTRLAGWSVLMADFDNDGWKDIFTANSHVTDNIEAFSGDRYKLRNTLFWNTGKSTFRAGPQIGDERAHRGAAVADFNGDGKPDIAVTALGTPALLWLNDTGTANHWIDIKLIGTKSNRDGIGARIRLGSQTNTQTSAYGYASSSLGPVHFGLGTATSVPALEVQWPSGRAQTIHNPQLDRVLTVTEP